MNIPKLFLGCILKVKLSPCLTLGFFTLNLLANYLILTVTAQEIKPESPQLPNQSEPIPNPITPRNTEKPTPELPSTNESPSLEIPSFSTPQATETIPGTIKVTQFEFVGNTAFTKAELSQELEPYLNREITFAELLQVEEIITQKYVNAGYLNSGAVIPANQTLSREGAVITIEIVEGGIEDIVITGTHRLNSNYVRSRLALATKKPFNRNQLLEALQLLQLDPLIQNISAELSAGVRRDSSLLEVKVTEANSFEAAIFTNNGRNPSVGSWRRGIRLQEGNLLGLGDGIEVVYTNTDGSNSVDASYTIPFNAGNGTLKIAGGFNDTEVIEPPFDKLDITGNSHYFEVGVRQPVILSPRQELALGLTTSLQRSNTELSGTPYPLSRGANAEGETNVSAIRFFQDWTKRNPKEVIALRSQFSFGVDIFDATINNNLPDSRFFAWRGQGQYVRLLAPETLLVVRSDLQFASDELLPLEQIGIGGFASVRGYRQDTLLTDNGFFTSAEIRFPVLRAKQIDGVLQIVPFVDFGVGWNSGKLADPDPNALVGIGVGLNWQMGNQLNARLDWGIPLTDVNNSHRTWQENGIYFSIDWKFF